MSETQNNQPSADNATEQGGDMLGMASELGPNGLPIAPPAGDEGAKVDHNLIMDTFFGEGDYEPNSDEGQGQGSNSSDGQSDKGSLAPPSPAPAANEGEGSPQPGPSPTPQKTGEQQAGGEGGTAQTPGQENQPSPESQPAAPTGLTAEDRLALASVDALKRQNAELLARLNGGSQQQPQTPEGQGQQSADPSTQPGGQEPIVRLTVPENLVAAIFDENPQTARQGLDILVSAVATNAVQAAMKHVAPMIDQRMAAVTQALQASETVSKMETAYYDAFPTHQNELYKPLIQSVVDEKYKQFPHAKWDADMISAVGATVNAKLTELGITTSLIPPKKADDEPPAPNGQGQQPQGQQPFQRRQKPAPMLDSTTKTDTRVHDNAGDFIRSTFA